MTAAQRTISARLIEIAYGSVKVITDLPVLTTTPRSAQTAPRRRVRLVQRDDFRHERRMLRRPALRHLRAHRVAQPVAHRRCFSFVPSENGPEPPPAERI